MTDGPDRWQELDSVLDRVLDGIYDEADLRRLNAILRADKAACRRYIHYVELHGRLAWGDGVGAAVEDSVAAAVEHSVAAAVELPHQHGGDNPSVSPASLPIVIQTAPDLPTPYSPIGGFLFSYAVAAVTVALGLLFGWMYQVSVSQHPIAQESRPGPVPTPVAKAPEMQFVGQITGTFDCQWADASTAAVDRASVPVGRRYALASGLLEISYDRGAKVILQGPCTYQVESAIGGYLALGKLTAKVEKRGERREERGEGREESGGSVAKGESVAANRRSPSPLSPLPPPLSPLRSPPSALPSPPFTVRTPTAVVTDLGTEFAVEVDKSGASRAHVFRGKVEVRTADSSGAKPVSLRANESARVDLAKDGAVVRESGPKRPFVREMPRSLPIVLFNTGVGLKKGDPDPHWQVVARSDDANFQPRPAVAWGVRDEIYLADDPAGSQWLSLAAGNVEFPQDVVYVFRTTFDLTGRLPSKAVLRGKFLADDRLVGIRLNGHRLPVPLHRDGTPFLDWTSFQISAGFVNGRNVLEFDVLNSSPYQSPSERRTLKSRMSFRAELQGTAASDPEFGDNKVGGTPSRDTAEKSPVGDALRGVPGAAKDGVFLAGKERRGGRSLQENTSPYSDATAKAGGTVLQRAAEASKAAAELKKAAERGV